MWLAWGAYLVDILPSLMYLPFFLAPLKREAARLHAEELDLFRSQQADARKRLANHDPTAADTFMVKFLNGDPASYNLSEDGAAYIIGTLFEARGRHYRCGSNVVLLAMTLHPDAFAKLQAELDTVVGPDRPPGFADIEALRAFATTIKETLHWRPVTAGGVQHLLVRDDVYDLTDPSGKSKTSYMIRASTNIDVSQWAIYREEALCTDPESFCPKCWLEPSWSTYQEPLSMYPNLLNFGTFGFGRWICLGRNVAERSLNIGIVLGCEIKRKDGRSAGEYDDTTWFDVQPKNFAVELELRARWGKMVGKEWMSVWVIKSV